MIRRLFLLLSLCLPLSTLAAEELLEVDKAFRLSARALDRIIKTPLKLQKMLFKKQ